MKKETSDSYNKINRSGIIIVRMTKFSLYYDHVSVFTLFLTRTIIEHPRAQKTNYN